MALLCSSASPGQFAKIGQNRQCPSMPYLLGFHAIHLVIKLHNLPLMSKIIYIAILGRYVAYLA